MLYTANYQGFRYKEITNQNIWFKIVQEIIRNLLLITFMIYFTQTNFTRTICNHWFNTFLFSGAHHPTMRRGISFRWQRACNAYEKKKEAQLERGIQTGRFSALTHFPHGRKMGLGMSRSRCDTIYGRASGFTVQMRYEVSCREKKSATGIAGRVGRNRIFSRM